MTSFPASDTYADQLVELARWASRNGWAPATSTNYSVRLPEEAAPALCAITGSGIDKATIDHEHILAVDRYGRPLQQGLVAPSAETLLHVMLYRSTNAGAVLHTHSLAATVLSRRALSKGHLVLSGWELLKGLDAVDTHAATVVVPIYPNSQDIPALAASIEPSLAQPQPSWAFLLAGHGLYAWGDTISSAQRHLEALEFLLQCELEMSRHDHAAGA